MGEHRCQPSDDAHAELAVLRLIHFLAPYMASSPPLVSRTVWVPRQRQSDRDAQRRIRNLQDMAGIHPRGGRA